MDKTYFCFYSGNYGDEFTGRGDSPKKAYDEVCGSAGDDNVNPLECIFYKAKEIEVSVETKIEIVED